ncbi:MULTISPECIES: hypothetical protein [unclassified Acinetobacter]|uniref:hypothetical protein n=1 Tax=unclassified Acinetobacter TaxID=196816 RepID=UPI0015D377FC|nr:MULTISPECIES: hypothetical protein [unclassified Acinetobacter]
MIYYSTTKAKFLQLVRERFTYAEANGEVCLISYHEFHHYQDALRVIRGRESKKGWIERYNLEASASTRHRHKKTQPVFDLVLMASVKSESEPVKYNLANNLRVTVTDISFDHLERNHFEDVRITACLVVTIPKSFLVIEHGKPALFDIKNQDHVSEINKKLKALIPNVERFNTPVKTVLLKNYKILKRGAKITPEKAEAKYQRELKAWEKEFARNPETAGNKPKKTSVPMQEWTVCLSEGALNTIRDALNGLILTYQGKKNLFLKDVDRVHGFLSKYVGHRGVRSDIGREYGVFRRTFKNKCGKDLDKALDSHTLKLGYFGQLKDEYKHWEYAHFYPKDNLELMMLRSILSFYENTNKQAENLS